MIILKFGLIHEVRSAFWQFRHGFRQIWKRRKSCIYRKILFFFPWIPLLLSIWTNSSLSKCSNYPNSSCILCSWVKSLSPLSQIPLTLFKAEACFLKFSFLQFYLPPIYLDVASNWSGFPTENRGKGNMYMVLFSMI